MEWYTLTGTMGRLPGRVGDEDGDPIHDGITAGTAGAKEFGRVEAQSREAGGTGKLVEDLGENLEALSGCGVRGIAGH
jgi:hypothetical protein